MDWKKKRERENETLREMKSCCAFQTEVEDPVDSSDNRKMHF